MITVGEITFQNLAEIQVGLQKGRLSCYELVTAYLNNLDKGKDLNAFVEVYREQSLDQAKKTDQLLAVDPSHIKPLTGAIISVKDVIAHEGHELTAGSRILNGYVSLYSATVVTRLLDSGAIVIGRVNCDEFAMGSDNRTSYHGPVMNGIDPEFVPGGSSGGSAVSVQIDACLASIGSDTGGSVRQPASFCGLTGFKPSYGRISRHGLIAYGSSFDQIGVIGRDMNDIRKIYEVIQGPDDYDSTLVQPDQCTEDVTFSKLAYLAEAVEHPSVQPEIRDSFLSKLSQLRAKGMEIEPVSSDLIDYLIPAYYILTSAEASSNLSRYDGIRYGYRSRQAEDLVETYRKTRTEGFGMEVKRRILLGTFVLSVGYYDAYFGKAQKVRRLIRDQVANWMQEYDALLLPTTPRTAWSVGASMSPVEIYLSDVFSVLANLAGCPAVSLPLGKDVDNLPFGIQLISGTFQENKLFVYSELISSSSSPEGS